MTTPFHPSTVQSPELCLERGVPLLCFWYESLSHSNTDFWRTFLGGLRGRLVLLISTAIDWWIANGRVDHTWQITSYQVIRLPLTLVVIAGIRRTSRRAIASINNRALITKRSLNRKGQTQPSMTASKAPSSMTSATYSGGALRPFDRVISDYWVK